MAVQGHDVRDLRAAQGQGAGLVQRHHAHPGQILQMHTPLDEDAVAPGGADGRHQGDGNRDHQRTGGGGDDEHSGAGQPLLPAHAQQARHDGEQDAHQQHHRTVAVAETFDETLAFALAGLGLLHQLDDARQGVVCRCLGSAHSQRTLAIEGGGEHRIAKGLFHRHGLPGDRRLVEAGAAVDDLAIGGHRLAGIDDEHIAHPQFLDRNAHLLSIAPHQGGLRRQIHEGADGVARALLGIALGGLGDGVEEHQHGGLGPLPHEPGHHGRHAHQQLNADFTFAHQLRDGLAAEIPAADNHGEDIKGRRHRCWQAQLAAHETHQQQQPG